MIGDWSNISEDTTNNEINFSHLPYELCSGIVDTFYNCNPIDQLIFYSRVFHGLKYREIAGHINLSLQAVGVRYKNITEVVKVKYEVHTGVSGNYFVAPDRHG